MISRFFQWWFGELAGFLPRGLRSAFQGTKSGLVVEFDDQEALLQHDDGSRLEPVGKVNHLESEPDEQRRTVKRLLKGTLSSPTSVSVRLPKNQVLRRKVELPSATAENLREVLSFEMDRHTPFKAREVYYDYRIEGANPQTDRIAVELAVVPMGVAQRFQDKAEGWGFEVDEVGVAYGDTYEAPFFKLVSADRRHQGRGVARAVTAILAIAILGLLLVAAYLPLERKKAELAAVENRLQEVRKVALEADKLRNEVEERLAQSEFLVGLKRGSPSVTHLFDEVTGLLPDNTWVIQFSRKGDTLTLAGYSSKASSLIGLLEESALFDEVRFSSPVTLDSRLNLDRFNITASISGQGEI